jgi:hypothetical protein
MGVIPIEEKKRIDWNAIRAEYIAGASYRALAQKYGVNKSTILDRRKAEAWEKDKAAAADMARTRAVQCTAEAAADNATIAARLKKKLLLRLERTEAAFPLDATECKLTVGGKTSIYRLRDLTAAYKDLIGDMDTGEQAGNELLQSLIDLERGRT